MHYFWIQEVSVSRDHLTSATKEFEQIHKDLETDLHHAQTICDYTNRDFFRGNREFL